VQRPTNNLANWISMDALDTEVCVVVCSSVCSSV
jgi:hypothetical protein